MDFTHFTMSPRFMENRPKSFGINEKVFISAENNEIAPPPLMLQSVMGK
jgi:hypothetical protein